MNAKLNIRRAKAAKKAKADKPEPKQRELMWTTQMIAHLNDRNDRSFLVFDQAV